MTETALATAEFTRLAELESVVARGLATFVEVGEALLEIRDSRLYRETHSTFDDYCRERWSMSKTHANRLIDSGLVARAVTPIGVKATPQDWTTIPANEAQARELKPLLLEPELLREAWAEVVELHPEPTAADVREVVGRKMDVHYSSSTPEWSTPQDVFDALDLEFGFTLDVCANAENAKCDRYFTAEQDGLAQEWTGICWMNPPYGDGIGAWVRKARESAEAGATVVCLVPARVETAWWWDNCWQGEVRFIRGRLKFGGGDTGAPFPSALVVFGREANIPASARWQRP